MIIVLSGLIGTCETGGQAWAYMQYLSGLRELGHEVYYLEDCPAGEGYSSELYVWSSGQRISDIDRAAGFVDDCLGLIGCADRWIFRVGDRSRGMAEADFLDVCARADLLIARASPLWNWREEYSWPNRRVFIDVDPSFTQTAIADPDTGWAEALGSYHHLFTIGQGVGNGNGLIPTNGHRWHRTRPPVSLKDWDFAKNGPASQLTSVIRLNGPFNDPNCQRRGVFDSYLDLPRRTSQDICLAVRKSERDYLTENGWGTVLAEEVARTPASYRQFVEASRGEFLLAKNGYVSSRSGWLSDRSVCYLAAGRPVVMQNTGLPDWLPTGEGLLTFSSLPEAVEAIAAVNADYEGHRRASRSLAETYFATDRLLPEFLETALS